MIKRRQFITLLGGAAAWPLAARAQQMKRIGVLMGLDAADPIGQSLIAALRGGLRDLGWDEGRNIRIEERGVADSSRTPALAAELVSLSPDVIVVDGPGTAIAVRELSRRIPVVFTR